MAAVKRAGGRAFGNDRIDIADRIGEGGGGQRDTVPFFTVSGWLHPLKAAPAFGHQAGRAIAG